MKVQIVSIGNSQGIRIPKILLEQSGLGKEVELEVCEAGILIKKTNKPRENWEEIFKAINEKEEEELFEVGNKLERGDWKW